MILETLLAIFFLYLLKIFVFDELFKRKPSFNNKCIWITGASSGIGEQLAINLSKLGANLVISARRVQELERVKKLCKNPQNVNIFQLDLSDPIQVLTEAKKFASKNQIDILINNGGVSMRDEALNMNYEQEQQIMNVNFNSAVALTKAVLPQMINRNVGHIVNIGSIQGKLGIPYRSSYAASKHALIGYFDCLRSEIKKHNINITMVCPGYVQTNLGNNAIQSGMHADNEKKGITSDKFSQLCCQAIYERRKEIIISDDFTHKLAVALRNIFPETLFNILSKRAKN